MITMATAMFLPAVAAIMSAAPLVITMQTPLASLVVVMEALGMVLHAPVHLLIQLHIIQPPPVGVAEEEPLRAEVVQAAGEEVLALGQPQPVQQLREPKARLAL